MNGDEIKRKIWNEINEYCATIGRGERPAFIVLHPAAVSKIVQNEYEGKARFIAYTRAFSPNDLDRLYGVPILQHPRLSEDEILLGITPLQKIEL